MNYKLNYIKSVIYIIASLSLLGCITEYSEEYGFDIPTTSIAWSVGSVNSDNYNVDVSATVDGSTIYGSELIGAGFLVKCSLAPNVTGEIVEINDSGVAGQRFVKIPCDLNSDNRISTTIENIGFDDDCDLRCYVETEYSLICIGSTSISNSKSSFTPTITDYSVTSSAFKTITVTINYSIANSDCSLSNTYFTFANNEFQTAAATSSNGTDYQIKEVIDLAKLNAADLYGSSMYIKLTNSFGYTDKTITMPDNLLPVISSDGTGWIASFISFDTFDYSVKYSCDENLPISDLWCEITDSTGASTKLNTEYNISSNTIAFQLNLSDLETTKQYKYLTLYAENILGQRTSTKLFNFLISASSASYQDDKVYDDCIRVCGIDWAKGNMSESYTISSNQWNTGAYFDGVVSTSYTSSIKGTSLDPATNIAGGEWVTPNTADFNVLVNGASLLYGYVNNTLGILFFAPQDDRKVVMNSDAGLINLSEDLINNSACLFLPFAGAIVEGSYTDVSTCARYYTSTMALIYNSRYGSTHYYMRKYNYYSSGVPSCDYYGSSSYKSFVSCTLRPIKK